MKIIFLFFNKHKHIFYTDMFKNNRENGKKKVRIRKMLWGIRPIPLWDLEQVFVQLRNCTVSKGHSLNINYFNSQAKTWCNRMLSCILDLDLSISITNQFLREFPFNITFFPMSRKHSTPSHHQIMAGYIIPIYYRKNQ